MRVQVAVGILVNGNELLIQRRKAGTDCAYQWEFPGGKIELGETPEQALKRELKEELGISIQKPSPITRLDHDYVHAAVALHTYIVNGWQGQVVGREGQLIRWVTPEQAEHYDLLEAAYPLLNIARVYLESRLI